jgi:hypothetical protein
MPVSKKRKKDGKPVQRKVATPVPDEANPHGPDAAAGPEQPSRPTMGRPANPFVALQRKASQRGR